MTGPQEQQGPSTSAIPGDTSNGTLRSATLLRASQLVDPLPSTSASGPRARRPRSGFIGYIFQEVASSPDTTPELDRWFDDPPTPPPNEPLDQIYPAIRYRDPQKRPKELQDEKLLNAAENYYKESKPKWKFSIILTMFLMAIFSIPASLVFLIIKVYGPSKRAFTSWFEHRRHPKDSPQGEAKSPDESKNSKPSTETEEPGASVSDPEAEQEDLGNLSPGRLARRWALYTVFVIFTVRLACLGGIRGLLLPSTSPAFRHDLADSRKKGNELLENAQAHRKRMQRLWKQAAQWEREAAKRLEDYGLECLKEQKSSSEFFIYEDPKFLKLEKILRERRKLSNEHNQAVHDADEQIKRIKAIAKTEACTDATGYNGVADWAQDAHASYYNLIQSISGVCFLGAGLTYAAIFGAVRGDVGLMTWAFGLFICALAVLVTVQSILLWCTRLENYPFSTPTIWEFFLGFAVYGSCGLVIGAIALLVVTVMDLRYDVAAAEIVNALSAAAASGNNTTVVPCPSGQYDHKMFVANDTNGTALCNVAAFGGNYVPGDAHLTFGVTTKKPAIVAFSFVAVGISVAILVFLFFAVANGIKLLLFRRSIERTKKPRIGLYDLESGGSWEELIENDKRGLPPSASASRQGTMDAARLPLPAALPDTKEGFATGSRPNIEVSGN